MRYDIIGREKEKIELEYLLQSDKSEFVAIYGRRRVGKSYLINEIYRENIVFRAIGIYRKVEEAQFESYRQEQLAHFYGSLVDQGLPTTASKPTSWHEAFRLLKQLLQRKRSKRKVVFLDELPWMAGPQSSELIAELGFFWNDFAVLEKDIILVVCGSATSWMLDNVIREYGGLYSRLTSIIHLHPFTMKECEQYFLKHNFHLSRYEMTLAYMAIGGIPYYLDQLRPKRTLTENIDAIFFQKAIPKQEFEDIYVGLFNSKDNYLDIVTALGKHFYGLTRNEIIESVSQSSGGGLSKMLDNLEESDIIRTYTRQGGKRKETVYQLTDFYTLFYLHYIENTANHCTDWRSVQRTPQFFAWAGLCFELVAAMHLPQWSKALSITRTTNCYCWKGVTPSGVGAQIDLVIEWKGERTDYVVEIKFSENKFTIDAAYKDNLLNKLDAYMSSNQHKPTHSVQLVLLTTMGLNNSIYADVVNSSITLDQLFNL